MPVDTFNGNIGTKVLSPSLTYFSIVVDNSFKYFAYDEI